MTGPLERADFLARADGLLGEQILDTTVLIAGAGSVGSYMAELLVRSGVRRLIVVDPDIVAGANLCRSNFEAVDIGALKVDALHRRLHAVNPEVQVQSEPSRLEDLGKDRLANLIEQADLVLGAVDSNKANNLLCRFAYYHRVPSLHVGIWARGSGGEVVLSAPPGPCYICATAMRHAAEDVRAGTVPAQSYGMDTAAGVNALVPDIQHVASAGAKLALGLLSADSAMPARRLVNDALQAQWPFLVIGNDADYWAFPALFSGVPGQLAFQSVWTGAERRNDCAVCGAEEFREDPASVWTAGLSAAVLRQVRDASREGRAAT